MWYSDLFRRHLLDMHIEDWDEVFLSEFSPETYVENLKKARINYAMIYLQSHAGLCYWPTESGVMHRALVKDPTMIRKTVELCRKAGIRVCGYYSLIYNTREHDRHPDWRMITDNGRSRRENNASDDSLAFASVKAGRYGLCCPSNPDYQQFVLTQIDESDFYAAIPALREQCGDRAVMRAIHFYQENARVPQQVKALEQGDFEGFLKLITESGQSSWMYLQNVIPAGYKAHQEVAVALGLCQAYLKGRGAYRVHGGGFAGTVQALVPFDLLEEFVAGIDGILGKGACHVLSIRPQGGVEMVVE